MLQAYCTKRGENMHITHERENDTIIISFRDELDHHEARKAIDYLDSVAILYPVEKIMLDLSGLTFMDSSGLAVVINLHRTLSRTGRKLFIRGTPKQAMRVFHAAGLPRLITFIDNKGEVQC